MEIILKLGHANFYVALDGKLMQKPQSLPPNKIAKVFAKACEIADTDDTVTTDYRTPVISGSKKITQDCDYWLQYTKNGVIMKSPAFKHKYLLERWYTENKIELTVDVYKSYIYDMECNRKTVVIDKWLEHKIYGGRAV